MMNDILKTIQGTPIPVLLILSGIFFLLLGITGGISGKINVPQEKQKPASFYGALLLILGLLINFMQFPKNIETITKPNPITKLNSTANSKPNNIWENWDIIPEVNITNSKNEWDISSFSLPRANGTREIVGDKLIINCNFTTEDGGLFFTKAYKPVTDFYFATNIRTIKRSDNNSVAGIIFRSTGNKYYALLIDNNCFKLCFKNNAENNQIIDWIYTPNINIYKKNRIAVLAYGDLISIFINDKKIVSLSDHSSFMGNIGLSIEGNVPSNAAIEFDNIVLYEKPI